MKLLLTLFLSLLISVAVIAQVKKQELPAVKPAFQQYIQIVVVTTQDWDKTTGTATLFDRKDTKSKWKRDGENFPVVVGRSGLAWGDHLKPHAAANKIKQEGDGTAPAGAFPLTAAFGTSTKPEALELPYIKLVENTECVDDPKSSFYNRIVNRMQVGNFDWKSSEKMFAVGETYALGIFVGYNSYPVEAGRGSCIFLHIWQDASTATDGGTAMERRNVERIAAWASPNKNPYLVQLTKDDYKKYQKSWKLPKL